MITCLEMVSFRSQVYLHCPILDKDTINIVSELLQYDLKDYTVMKVVQCSKVSHFSGFYCKFFIQIHIKQ